MKKYPSKATKALALTTLLWGLVLLAGVVLMIVGAFDISVQIGLMLSGGLMTVLFFTCFLAERSRTLAIDDKQIVFPRGMQVNGKTVFHKTVVAFDDIRCVESRFYKGDKILTGDCYFHTLTLKDGTKISVTLYAYGQKAEQEILRILRKR